MNETLRNKTAADATRSVPAGVLVKWLLTLLLPVLAGCGAKEDTRTATASDEDGGLALPLPEVPDSIAYVEDKLLWAGVHFWDAMDFTDTSRSLDDAFMEQNFANFALILQSQGEDDSRRESIRTFLSRASINGAALDKAVEIARLYLADPNSPMRSEDVWIDFLEVMTTGMGFCDDAERERLEYELELTLKNRPGMVAEDFAYVGRDGKSSRLYATAGGQEGLIVVFYDHDCEHCKQTMALLIDDKGLQEAVEEKRVTLLAVDLASDREAWAESADRLPPGWIAAMNTDDLREREAYWLPALPSIYLLASDFRVLAKDITISDLSGN